MVETLYPGCQHGVVFIVSPEKNMYTVLTLTRFESQTASMVILLVNTLFKFQERLVTTRNVSVRNERFTTKQIRNLNTVTLKW